MSYLFTLSIYLSFCFARNFRSWLKKVIYLIYLSTYLSLRFD